MHPVIDKASNCNIGVVATKILQEKDKSFTVEGKRKNRFRLFSSKNPEDHNVKVCEVLAATANAPVFFEEPVKVTRPGKEDEYFVDGGLGANCPITQALQQKSTYGTIISIAPAKKDDHKMKGWAPIGWFQYMQGELFDGDELYEDEKERNKDKMFVRLRPLSRKCAKHGMDCTNTEKMVEDVIEESETDPRYFLQMLHAAVLLLKSFKIRRKMTQPLTEDQERIAQLVVKGIQEQSKAKEMKLDEEVAMEAESHILAVVKHFKRK